MDSVCGLFYDNGIMNSHRVIGQYRFNEEFYTNGLLYFTA